MISTSEISEGDIVRLKSGSPKMIVTDVIEAEQMIEVLLWSDRLGFVERAIPLEYLVWPHGSHDGGE